MSTGGGSAWLVWAIAIGVALPLGLVLLTELHNALSRRGSAVARPVGLLRTYILPLAALLALLTQASEISAEATPVRIVATALGFVLLLVVLSTLNAALFQGAPQGSWRSRMPSIFLDVARFAIIAAGLAVIFAFIWGANVGGLFAALGVTSIVLGLALQNAAGAIISGLLLLFEQPFRLGDWVSTPLEPPLPPAVGRVVEVNWRATHIDTGSGLVIMPNSVLATVSFANLSRPPGEHGIDVTTTFALADPPDVICALLDRVADALPGRRTGEASVTVATGAGTFRTSVALLSPADDVVARTTFLRWVWYAARRAGLHLDGADDDFSTPDRVRSGLQAVAPTLRLSADEHGELAPHARVLRYGAGEFLQHPGSVPDRMLFVMSGRVQLCVPTDDGDVPVHTLVEGDFLGQTALTREPVVARAAALDEVTVLHLDRDCIDDLVARKPALLHDIGRAIEARRRSARAALDGAAAI